MAEIARAAGVGRVTLYAHFPSREALLDAVLGHAIEEATAVIGAAGPEHGPVDEVLRRLVRTSWQILDRHRRLFALAQAELGPARLRERHDPALSPIEGLLERGRQDGTIRTDLPLGWLVTTFYTLLHAAADDVNTGRLPHTDAARVLDATFSSAFAPPR